VRAFQDLSKIDTDGRAGPQTQTQLAQRLIRNMDSGLPGGLMLSVVDYESSGYVAAVNWQTVGGVDCGMTQRRVLGPPFADTSVRNAFDSLYQLSLLRSFVIDRHTRYMPKPAVHTHEFAWRLAVYGHNRPSDADHFADVPYDKLTPYWTEPKQWVMDMGRLFVDGSPVRSIWDWACRYALGNKAHNEPGQAVKLVSDWSSA
jgi:hypothetical protein